MWETSTGLEEKLAVGRLETSTLVRTRSACACTSRLIIFVGTNISNNEEVAIKLVCRSGWVEMRCRMPSNITCRSLSSPNTHNCSMSLNCIKY